MRISLRVFAIAWLFLGGDGAIGSCENAIPQESSEVKNQVILAHELSDAFTQVYEKLAPAVVVIEAPPALAFLQTPVGQSTRSMSQGSGFLISSDGFLLTNYHLIQGANESAIRITLQDGRRFSAKIVGTDEYSDVAVLKISASHLPIVEFADSDKVRIGQFAFTLGAPYDLPGTFTFGIVSGLHRSNLTEVTGSDNYIQTNAELYPGSSGGPLADIDGKVIGINTLFSTINRGLSFAVPINEARSVAQQLMIRGHVSRPWLGIEIQSLSDDPTLLATFPQVPEGVLIRTIRLKTPAAESELRPGDIILAVDNHAVRRAAEVRKRVLARGIGESIRLRIWSNGKTKTISIKTVEQPTPPLPHRSEPAPSPQRISPTLEIIGLQTQSLNDALARTFGVTASKGVVVTHVEEKSAAEVAGIVVGDVIQEVGSILVNNQTDFLQAIQSVDLHAGVLASIDRQGQRTIAILRR